MRLITLNAPVPACSHPRQITQLPIACGHKTAAQESALQKIRDLFAVLEVRFLARSISDAAIDRSNSNCSSKAFQTASSTHPCFHRHMVTCHSASHAASSRNCPVVVSKRRLYRATVPPSLMLMQRKRWLCDIDAAAPRINYVHCTRSLRCVPRSA